MSPAAMSTARADMCQAAVPDCRRRGRGGVFLRPVGGSDAGGTGGAGGDCGIEAGSNSVVMLSYRCTEELRVQLRGHSAQRGTPCWLRHLARCVQPALEPGLGGFLEPVDWNVGDAIDDVGTGDMNGWTVREAIQVTARQKAQGRPQDKFDRAQESGHERDRGVDSPEMSVFVHANAV